MAVIRKFNLHSACYQTVMKTTTKIAILITDLGLNKTYIGITKKWERNNHPTVRSRKPTLT